MTGILNIVATPIGNLGDLTDRARQVLAEADVVAAEDTRRARTLLEPGNFAGKLVAYHDFSDTGRAQTLIDSVLGGNRVALISDAGTPLISDPGYKLVRMARDQGVTVIPIPGVSALTAALSVAGLPTDRFGFEGFPPARDAARRNWLADIADKPRTLVFYESPHRIIASVQDMLELFGSERPVFLAREMTKKFEQHFSGNLAQCQEWLQADPLHTKGEFVLVIAGASATEIAARAQAKGLQLVRELRDEVSLKRAVALAAAMSGARKNELYKAALAEQTGD